MQRLILIFLSMAFLATGQASACSIPVFRYALERWKPSPHELIIFHKGELTEETKKFIRELEDANPAANLTITPVDLLGKVEPDHLVLWKAQGDKVAVPHAVLRPPDADESSRPLWSGPLDRKALAPWLDSPARQKIVRLLTTGESAVFVLLRSGDKKDDDAARQLLKKELARLEKALALPEMSEEGPQLRSELPLRISFKILEVSRTEEAEAGLVRMLLSSEEGLEKVIGPIIFPVFGRGRVLCGLGGKELTAKELDWAARFLTGACSCQVKELNPGVDLLIQADWDGLLEVPEVREQKTVEKGEEVTIPPGKTDEAGGGEPTTTEREKGSGWPYLLIGLGVVFVVATGIWVLRGSTIDQGAPGSRTMI